MATPGEQRPAGATPSGVSSRSRSRIRPPRTLPLATLLALGLALLAAVVWALLRGIFDLGPGLIVMAVLVGWGIGVIIRQVRGSPAIAIVIAGAAWLLGLIGTWLVSMAILQGSSRTFVERLEATPFLDFIGPQLGLFEWGALALYVLGAAYGARRSAIPGARDEGD